MHERRNENGLRISRRSRFRLLLRPFIIEVRFEILCGDFRFHAVRRNLDARRPKDRVENQFALLVVAPTFVEMSAGEAEAAASVGSLERPCSRLRFLRGDLGADRWVALVRSIFAAHRAVRRDRGKDVRELAGALVEAHVKIPFIVRAKGLHAIGNRMLRQFPEVRLPVRIHRPILFEESAHPVQRLWSAFVRGKFHRIVQTDEARAAFHFPGDLLKMIAAEQKMSAAAIRVEENRIGLRKFLRVRPFGVEMHLRDHVRRSLSEALREELHAGIMFMIAGSMRLASGEQQHARLAIRSFGLSKGAQQKECGENGTQSLFHDDIERGWIREVEDRRGRAASQDLGREKLSESLRQQKGRPATVNPRAAARGS
jgi:hypothetical protein